MELLKPKLFRKQIFLYLVFFILLAIVRSTYKLYNLHVPRDRRKDEVDDLLRRWIITNTKFQSYSKRSDEVHERVSDYPELKIPPTEKIGEVAKINASECLPSENLLRLVSAIKTPFKIFIYDLPPKFNRDLIQCLQPAEVTGGCYSLQNCGMGKILFNITDKMYVMDTHMFSLEVVLHHKLLFSTYRTMDPLKADIFYIPAYGGLRCLCNKPEWSESDVDGFVDDLLSFLSKQPYFRMGKPHFSSAGKIQREMQSLDCKYLPRLLRKNITFFSIESSLTDFVLSAPYPSYIHYVNGRGPPSHRDLPDLSHRDVFILLAAGKRRSNPDRARIMDQFSVQTTQRYRKYKRTSSNSRLDMVFYYTDECRKEPRFGTVPWMMHSVFCLQPPGDSPTRKSFFDALLSGCIPVLFPYKDLVTSGWPFLDFFSYSEFTVTIRLGKFLENNDKVLDILKRIPTSEIKRLHNNVLKVSQWFQYSAFNGDLEEPNDAMLYIFKELQKQYQLGVQESIAQKSN